MQIAWAELESNYGKGTKFHRLAGIKFALVRNEKGMRKVMLVVDTVTVIGVIGEKL